MDIGFANELSASFVFHSRAMLNNWGRATQFPVDSSVTRTSIYYENTQFPMFLEFCPSVNVFNVNSYTFPFNSSTEGTLIKCIFHAAHNAKSKDVDAVKFQLVRHDTFYNGQNQQDSTECLLMLIDIIHKGSMPDSS